MLKTLGSQIGNVKGSPADILSLFANSGALGASYGFGTVVRKAYEPVVTSKASSRCRPSTQGPACSRWFRPSVGRQPTPERNSSRS